MELKNRPRDAKGQFRRLMGQMQADEDALITAARAGSREAAAELFERHYEPVWQAAYRLTSKRDIADDATQDAFERALSSLVRFDGRSSLRTWITRIALNRSIDLLRTERRQADGYGGSGESDVAYDTPEEEMIGAVARLADDRRMAIVLRYWLDWTPAEIAAFVGVPIGTVNSRLARGLDDLRQSLEVFSHG